MNYIQAHAAFEARKNQLATVYTAIICALLFLLLVLVSWTLPQAPPPVVEEGLEVNLGNSDQGLGDKQAFLPGPPAAREEEKYTPPKQVAVAKEAYKDVETNDNDKDADETVVKKPPVTKPDATKIPDKDITPKKQPKTAQPVTEPAPPAPPRPKALFHGVNGNGNGGNDADTYKPGGNEGIAGGRGDQGAPGGDPDSKNYKGGGSGSGVAIARGLVGRSIRSLPSFTDEFNENAKVAVDIHVDAAGNVTSADYQPRGSTTSDATMKAIALRKARQVHFNAGDDESVGTLIFNFKLRN